MNGFEFLFSFYSLLLGLAVANVATGFADIWRGRRETLVGTSTVFLGLLVLFSAAQQWMSFWRGRDALTMGPWQILVSIAVALPFVFISRAMLPCEQDTWHGANGGPLYATLLKWPPLSAPKDARSRPPSLILFSLDAKAALVIAVWHLRRGRAHFLHPRSKRLSDGLSAVSALAQIVKFRGLQPR